MKVKLHDDFKNESYFEDGEKVSLMPHRATPGAAGADLRSAEEQTIYVNSKAVIRTGVMLEVPDGKVVDVRSRSGLASKYGIFVLNSPGTIDSDYRGEVKVILFNTGKLPFVVRRGMRIAQLVVLKVEAEDYVEAERLSETQRGSGGFGSTG